ncbi:type VII secretion protein EccC, partial [Streptomyces sp. NPDC006265]
MTQQVIHRPARSTRPLDPTPARTIEAPPNLPEGKVGNAATALLPMAGVVSSVVLMTVIRNSQFAAIGAIVLVVALLGAVALFLSQRGKAQRTRRVQRERYLEYLEELREELGTAERERRQAARELNPPPEALYDLVRDPARLWERRRRDTDFLSVRAGTGDVPAHELTIAQNSTGGVLTPPDPFMLNEARALQGRFGTATDFPLTVPLDRAGNVSIIGDREDVLRVAHAVLLQTVVTHAPDDVAVALGTRDEPSWAWAKWLPHILDPQMYDGPVAARRIASDLPELARLCGPDLRQRAAYAAEVRRGLSGRTNDALSLTPRMLLISDSYGGTAAELPRPDSAIGLPEMGVTVLHLLQRQVHEPDQVSVRITVDGDRFAVDDLRA